MSRSERLLTEEDGIFGPGMDLAISLAAMLILLLAIKSTVDESGQISLRVTLERQLRLADAIAHYYGTEKELIGNNTYGISIRGGSLEFSGIVIHNDVTLQRITFGDHLLFRLDEVDLIPEGRGVLQAVCVVLRRELPGIREIHIQGHADPWTSKRYGSNLDLAAQRAITVYRTFQSLGIDPTRAILSATSFGEYVPIQRLADDRHYSLSKLELDNDNSQKRQLNRRIEILLVYRRE